jgi:hypothetical protein
VSNFSLVLDGASPADVAALNKLVAGHGSLKGSTIAPADHGDGEQMGDIYDVLSGALGPGGAGTTFALLLAAWVRSRSKSFSCTVKTDVGQATLSNHPTDDLDAATERVAALFPDPHAGQP